MGVHGLEKAEGEVKLKLGENRIRADQVCTVTLGNMITY